MKKKWFLAILTTLVMIIGLIPATVLAGEADGAVNETYTYLYLDGIEGASTAPDHDKWIEAIYCYPSNEPQESGSGRGVAEKLKLKHRVDSASPQLQEHYMKGTTIATGKIHYCRQDNGQQKVIYAIELKGIKVTRAEIGVEDLPDGSFQLVETVEMKVDRTTRTENVPLPEDFDRTEIEPEAPIGTTEIERIRIMLDEYDSLVQKPAVKQEMDTVPGYTEWIAQLRIRLAELEREESEKENAASTSSNLSPATGITGSKGTLPVAFVCIGLAVIGLSVVRVRKRK